ncbi:kinesin-like nuclear fusion protein [Tilletia horrida]|nr:kinesin-like nuclear fusion protein [Tilletia horrida]
MSSNASASGSRLRQPGSISGLPLASQSLRSTTRARRAPTEPRDSNDSTCLPMPEDCSGTFLLDATMSLKDPSLTVMMQPRRQAPVDADSTVTSATTKQHAMPTPPAPVSNPTSSLAASSPANLTTSTSSAGSKRSASSSVNTTAPPTKRSRKRNSLAGPRGFAATHLNASGSARISPRTAIARTRLPTTSTPAVRKVSYPGVPAMSMQQQPRKPLGNATNRGSASASSTQPRIPSQTLQSAVAAGRRIPSQPAPAPTGNFAAAPEQEELLTERVDTLEQGMKTMADLLSEERRKAAEERSRLQDRSQKEDTGRQVAESALAQQMGALLMQMQQMQNVVAQAKKQGPRRSLEPEELEILQIKHAKEKRLLEEELAASKETITALRNAMAQNSTSHLTMESNNTALKLQLESQQSEIYAAQETIAALQQTITDLQASHGTMEAELRAAESLRRKLHNEIQELRGNIRVFARVRPRSDNDARNGSDALANILYPDNGAGGEKAQIEVIASAESATGTMTMRNHLFTFDRVFQPQARQSEVFEEISHLTQSVLDGYNVSIFAYGQTGSGKTFTLEGPSTETYSDIANLSEDAGMIPRAVQMLWQASEALKDKGWTYNFEGSILEIYCDGINDLLGKESFDKAHHEIKHDAKTGRTTVTDTVIVALKSPAEVFKLLEKAKKRRAVAATLMNERSSRSHSVFMLRARGQNLTTRQSCDAVLNLVDLAGSERLSNSGSASDPVRLREAQSINKSLSSLADVIAALGAAAKSPGGAVNAGPGGATSERTGGVHIPYRNSTLTWLLKNSLGGNSKTLMMLALSPMEAHLNESLCSLRFATKVNSTHIGTAKKVSA